MLNNVYLIRFYVVYKKDQQKERLLLVYADNYTQACSKITEQIETNDLKVTKFVNLTIT